MKLLASLGTLAAQRGAEKLSRNQTFAQRSLPSPPRRRGPRGGPQEPRLSEDRLFAVMTDPRLLQGDLRDRSPIVPLSNASEAARSGRTAGRSSYKTLICMAADELSSQCDDHVPTSTALALGPYQKSVGVALYAHLSVTRPTCQGWHADEGHCRGVLKLHASHNLPVLTHHCAPGLSPRRPCSFIPTASLLTSPNLNALPTPSRLAKNSAGILRVGPEHRLTTRQVRTHSLRCPAIWPGQQSATSVTP